MTTKPVPSPAIVSCDICLKEMPLSEARRFEAEDYVAHFCGLDCYAEWKQRSEKAKQQGKESSAE
ncbi:MAG: DUF3330 domain-containing protein [Sideroxydans sp.]|jgi:hydrogenase maturation factor HypF (carbamoyltransferase family)